MMSKQKSDDDFRNGHNLFWYALKSCMTKEGVSYTAILSLLAFCVYLVYGTWQVKMDVEKANMETMKSVAASLVKQTENQSLLSQNQQDLTENQQRLAAAQERIATIVETNQGLIEDGNKGNERIVAELQGAAKMMAEVSTRRDKSISEQTTALNEFIGYCREKIVAPAKE